MSTPYIIHDAPQGTPDWLEARKALKATSSKFGAIYLYSEGKVPHKWVTETAEQNDAMKMGVLCEPKVRNWFVTSKWWQKGWVMKEMGLVVPHFDPRIGSSVDGLIVDAEGKSVAIIEIKCPQTIYESLLRPRQFETEECDHITFTHYCQMQGGMAILDVEKCYYIVFGHGVAPDGTKKPHSIYVEEVKRNRSFWENKLYPAISKYIS